MTGVRGHEPTCPIARETWCLWTGDKCDHCVAYRKGYAAALDAARDAVAAVQIRTESGEVLTGGTWDHALLRALVAIESLRATP